MAIQLKIKNIDVHIGDTVKITYQFKEKDKEKSQIFKGIVVAFKGHGNNKMFLVRKVTKSKIAVERIFPINSPFITNVEVVKKGHVRRAKIYFIRNKSEKEITERLYGSK